MLEILRLHTPYRAMAPEWPTIIESLSAMMIMRAAQVWVAEHGKKLTGILIALAQVPWWLHPQNGGRIVSDLVFHSQRFGDGHRMLEAMTTWAFALPRVFRIEMGVSSGQVPMDVMSRIYERAGFVREGSLFVKNHPMYTQLLGGC